MRIAVLGNAGSGKSTLSAKLAKETGHAMFEVDKIMWKTGWAPVSDTEFDEVHEQWLSADNWIIDGMGRRRSLERRVERATHIVLCDFPIWQNFWLLSERQTAWAAGNLDLPPGEQANPPPTRDLFEFVWKIEVDFMPFVRKLVSDAGSCKSVQIVRNVEELAEFSLAAG